MSRPSVWVLLFALLAGAAITIGAPRIGAVAPTRPLDWLAPGDSYTSGHGTPGADTDDVCRTSADSWVYKARDVLGAAFPLTNGSPKLVACTGNTTDLFDTQWDGVRHDLITFNFGGDDVKFADVLKWVCPQFS